MAQTKVDYSQNPSGQELLDGYLGKEQENILTTNSGVQRPTYAKAGTIWLDLVATPWKLKAFDGNSDVVLGYINATTHAFTPAGDGNFVHKTGNEEIGGIKTFKGNILRNVEGLDVNTIPSSNKYLDWLTSYDENGKQVGFVGTMLQKDGLLASRLGVAKTIGGRKIYADIQVRITADGRVKTYAPTPPSNSNDDSVATTEWVIANTNATKHLVVSTLPAVIDPNAFYYIPE